MNNKIASTILDQLGGKRFIFMTGVSNLTPGANGVIMQLPRNASGAKYLRITLNKRDVYKMEFYTVRGSYSETISVYSGIFSNQLDSIFESVTGLFSKLHN